MQKSEAGCESVNVAGEGIQKHLLLVNAILFAQASLALAGAATLVFRTAGVQGYFRDLPTLVFSFTGLALVFSILVFSYETKCRLALLAVSLSISIYALEIGIRLLVPPVAPREIRDEWSARRADSARAMGVPFDTRMLLDVILELRKQGTFVYPSGSIETYLNENVVTDQWFYDEAPRWAVGQSVIQIDGEEVMPLGQPADFLGVGTDNEIGRYVLFKTDEHGFRNPPGLWSLESVDLVAVGDSFTEGSTVPDDQSFMSLIRKKVPRSINLGTGGGGPFTMLGCIREYGVVLKPKVTLWCFFEGNDLINLAERRHIPILSHYLQRDFRQNLLDRQPELDEAIRNYLEIAVERQVLLGKAAQQQRQMDDAIWGRNDRGRRLLSFITLDYTCWKLGLRHSGAVRLEKEHLTLFKRILATAKTEVESWGGKFYFVYLPSWERVADPQFKSRLAASNESDLSEDHRGPVLRIVSSLELDLIDLTLAFAAHPDPLSLFPFGMNGHYNPLGYELVADEIQRRLREDSAFPSTAQDR